MDSPLVVSPRGRSLVLVLVVLAAGCNGTMTETDTTPTVGEPSVTSEGTSLNGNASVAEVTITAQEQVTIELVVFVGDDEESGRAMTFYRLVELDAGETYDVRIPVIPNTDEANRDDDLLVVSSQQSSAQTDIASCRTYSFTVTNSTVTHSGTTVSTPSADSSTVETVTEGLGTEPPADQCRGAGDG